LEAVGDDSLLVLIGDPDQLPPIDAGSLFAEIGALFGVHLDRCMRTEEGHLLQLAQAVKRGNPEEFFRLLPIQSDPLSAEMLYARIDPIVSTAQPVSQTALEKYSRFRILNAVRQGPLGTDALNQRIFQMVQKTGKWWAVPILATVNDSFSEIYNGMSGILIGQGLREEAAYFPDPSSGEMRCFSSPPPYEFAFCLSIHKSQGSEFEEILALFPTGSENFGREALYTALTRAKKKIEIQGDREILQQMMASTSRMMSGFSIRIAS
jgi:exodeoxyribonuclease V alpha subunit